MIPVDQTSFGCGQGNCLSACVASILEIDIADVPNFCHEGADADGSTWLERFGRWLRERGWSFPQFNWGASVLLGDCWVIATGPVTHRGTDEFHAVVGRSRVGERQDGERDGVKVWLTTWHLDWVHDPHPSGTFLDGDPVDLLVLVPAAT